MKSDDARLHYDFVIVYFTGKLQILKQVPLLSLI